MIGIGLGGNAESGDCLSPKTAAATRVARKMEPNPQGTLKALQP